MKKIKRIITLMLAMMMVFSMSIISSAADSQKSAVITVTGAENATLTYAQVIKADTSTKTGWAIVPGYEAIFASFGNDEQSRIEGYIDADESVRAAAIKEANVSTSEPFTNPMTVHAAGLYLINGTEEGFEYNPMLAYIGFDDKSGEEKGLVDTTVKAKKTPKTVDKTIGDDDKFVEIGDEVTYTITATVPYSPAGATTALVINDELTGGTYKRNSNNKVDVTVSLGDNPTMEITPEENKLTIDLSALIKADNEYANKTVTVTYVAIVTDEVINNKASINNNPDTAVVTSYTGKLKITKMNENGSNSPEALAGAVFVVVNEDGKYAKFSGGKLAGWVDEIADDCKITTESDGTAIGTATVSGFEPNKTYKFHEVAAPEGYKVNPNDVTAEWKPDQADDAQIAEAVMHDSKLSLLPYTGGKGTAAFTIFGVILMGAAVSIYCVIKKNKSVK